MDFDRTASGAQASVSRGVALTTHKPNSGALALPSDLRNGVSGAHTKTAVWLYIGEETPLVPPIGFEGVGTAITLLTNCPRREGALAGIVATIGCHPLDTLKVVLQAGTVGPGGTLAALRHVMDARGNDRRTLCLTRPGCAHLATSNAGVTGLYAGVLPKLLSSAPCSAIYAATYEGVKSALLPLLEPRAHWIAHCSGGAAASIATSVVFTPLECIKARLQVGLACCFVHLYHIGSSALPNSPKVGHYSTAPEALAGIARSEGLGALYRGQEAVLWRNIPQSVVKFFVYEQLRAALALPHETWAHMLLGAAAGCSAALVTTPFDVVKSRMETLAPHPRGVGPALAFLVRKEGLGGLYRGLGPRLLIYLVQGAVFFSAYELLKATLGRTPVPLIRGSLQAPGTISCVSGPSKAVATAVGVHEALDLP